MLTGGCFCGAIRYEAGGTPFHETLCHCSMCRRSAGAPAVAWFSVPRAELRFLSGTPARFASSASAERGFCPSCGTTLTFEAKDLPEEIDITTASLDDPNALPPREHIYTSTRLHWMAGLDALPSFAEGRVEKK
jgi:hypothetical protein